MFSAASQSAGYKPAGRTDWKLEVYVPLTRAYRRKHPMFIPAPKITPNLLGNLNMTGTGTKKIRKKLLRVISLCNTKFR
jgi:hypothetical protein